MLKTFLFKTLKGSFKLLQNLEGSLEFWCKVITLKVDAYYRSLAIPTTFQCHPEIASSDKVSSISDESLYQLNCKLFMAASGALTHINKTRSIAQCSIYDVLNFISDTIQQNLS